MRNIRSDWRFKWSRLFCFIKGLYCSESIRLLFWLHFDLHIWFSRHSGLNSTFLAAKEKMWSRGLWAGSIGFYWKTLRFPQAALKNSVCGVRVSSFPQAINRAAPPPSLNHQPAAAPNINPLKPDTLCNAAPISICGKQKMRTGSVRPPPPIDDIWISSGTLWRQLADTTTTQTARV